MNVHNETHLTSHLTDLTSAAAGPIYIGEVTPSYIRGLIMAFWQMFYSVGSFVAYWVNYAAGKHWDTLGEWDWKMVVIFQLLLPVIIVCQLPFMPESPRWLVQRKHDVEGARKVLQQVRIQMRRSKTNWPPFARPSNTKGKLLTAARKHT
ncbi:unnamed protein product [Aspergillus oryzae]|nr:unnamed protein product [Aspergillus oryzae]GMF91609.1 unnamed protein product [Aspergillus oryzae]